MTSTTNKANICTFITEIIKTNGWFSPFYCDVNQVGGYNNVTTELFQQHIDTIASQSADLWITPFGNASKYHHERNVGAATITPIAEDATNWTLNLSDNLDNAIYNQPLTILLNEPSFSIQSITQNAVDIPFTLNAGVIKFNAIPDGGNIILAKNVSTGVFEWAENKQYALSQTVDDYVLTFNAPHPDNSNIALYDSAGKLVKFINAAHLNNRSAPIYVSNKEYPKG